MATYCLILKYNGEIKAMILYQITFLHAFSVSKEIELFTLFYQKMRNWTLISTCIDSCTYNKDIVYNACMHKN